MENNRKSMWSLYANCAAIEIFPKCGGSLHDFPLPNDLFQTMNFFDNLFLFNHTKLQEYLDIKSVHLCHRLGCSSFYLNLMRKFETGSEKIVILNNDFFSINSPEFQPLIHQY